jgi:flagellar export protein FliJ
VIKKFAFRLETVLRHRASILELRERALADVEGALQRERQVLADLLALKAEVVSDKARVQGESHTSLDLDLYHKYLVWVADEQEREIRVIGELETLRDLRRAELVAASQQHRITEKLKEREYSEYRKDTSRAEQNDLDETASNAYARGVRLVGIPTLKEQA